MAKNYKTGFDVEHQVESFFTGSQLVFDQSGEHFYCSCGSIINKVCVSDGRVKAQIPSKNESDNVIKFTITSDDALLIIAYCSGLVTKFNLTNDTIEREFKSIHSAPITQLKINLQDTLLATASTDGTVKLWNLVNHYCSHNLKGVNGVISCLEFGNTSLRHELLFCSAGDDCIHIFQVENSRRIAKLSKHCGTITDIKLCKNGQQLISIGRDKIAVVWDISDRDSVQFGSPIRTIPLYEVVESMILLESCILNKILDVQLDENRTIFATIGEEGKVKFWDTQTGSKILTQNEHPLSEDRSAHSPCFGLVERPNTNQICVISMERDIFFYTLPELRIAQQLQGHLDEVLSVCWFAKDRYLAIACNSNDLKIMEVETSSCQHLKGHTDIVLCVQSLPCDPYCIITSSKDCCILVWKFNPETMKGQILFKGVGHTHAIQALGVSPYEKVLFSAGEDTTLKRWVICDEKEHTGINNFNSLISSQTVKAHDSRIDAIDISPNDQLVATGSRDKTAKIFSATTLQIISTLKGHKRGVNAVKFSPVDQVVVTAADTALRLFNIQDSTCLKTFQGHDSTVLNFSFISTGLQLLSMGSDGNMKLWDCKTTECVRTVDAHEGSTWSLALTCDDSRVVTGGQDEKLIIWRDITEEERIERLHSLQNQVAQEQDFHNYINKKRWKKALKLAFSMESQSKTLSVIREIMMGPSGLSELEVALSNKSLDQVDFLIDCCVTWASMSKNSSIAQQVLNIIIKNYNNDQLLKLPAFINSLNQLKTLTEKSFDRCERLVQQAAFVDFFMNTLRIQ